MNSCGDLGNGKSILVGPEGDILHQSEQQEEIVPVVVDLERVRHSRKHGVLGLGQPLKSFRDRPLDFPQYSDTGSNYLDSLGELVKPERM